MSLDPKEQLSPDMQKIMFATQASLEENEEQ